MVMNLAHSLMFMRLQDEDTCCAILRGVNAMEDFLEWLTLVVVMSAVYVVTAFAFV